MLMVWAKAFFSLGLVLALVSLAPAAFQYVFRDVDPLIPGLLLLTVLPLAVLSLLAAAIAALAALLRRPPGP